MMLSEYNFHSCLFISFLILLMNFHQTEGMYNILIVLHFIIMASLELSYYFTLSQIPSRSGHFYLCQLQDHCPNIHFLVKYM